MGLVHTRYVKKNQVSLSNKKGRSHAEICCSLSANCSHLSGSFGEDIAGFNRCASDVPNNSTRLRRNVNISWA